MIATALAALNFAKLIPWKVWLVLGAALAVTVLFLSWLHGHDKAIRDAGTKHELAAVAAEKGYWQGRENESNAKYQAEIAQLQASLAIATHNAQVAAAAAAKALQEERARHVALQIELDKQRNENVTAEADRLCPVLTVGVVRQFNADAAGANGDDVAGAGGTAGAGAISVNAASPVSLSTYSRTVGAVEAALGECRTQVTGWQNYHATVILPWVASTTTAFQSCVPKGAP